MKMTALMVVVALTVAPQVQAYETDDFGFPVEQVLSSRSASSFSRARRGRVFRPVRTVRTTSPQYCPPSNSVAVRTQTQPAQPTVATTDARVPAKTVSTVKKVDTTLTNKTKLGATQASAAQPKS